MFRISWEGGLILEDDPEKFQPKFSQIRSYSRLQLMQILRYEKNVFRSLSYADMFLNQGIISEFENSNFEFRIKTVIE